MSFARYMSALALLLAVSPASSEWKPEYAQASPERQQWFQSQQINPNAHREAVYARTLRWDTLHHSILDS